MADLGNIGRSMVMDRFGVARAGHATTVRLFGDRQTDWPNVEARPAPVPTGGLKSMVFASPGVFEMERPVDPNTTVTISVKCRKSVRYGSANLPYLEIEAEGRRQKATMTDTNDTWVTLQLARTMVLASQVMIVRLIRPAPQTGSNWPQFVWHVPDDYKTVQGGLCWFADLQAAVA